jgi:hypothetical protein
MPASERCAAAELANAKSKQTRSANASRRRSLDPRLNDTAAREYLLPDAVDFVGHPVQSDSRLVEDIADVVEINQPSI